MFWLLAVAIIITLLVVLVYVVLDAVVFIEAVHFGVVWRFGGQTSGVRREGLNFKIPLIDTIKIASTELKTMPITVEFTCKDKLRIKIPGSLQFRADPNVLDEETGRNVFVRVSEEAIIKGVEKDVQAKLGGIGGWYDGEEFISNRQALGDLINSILRLKNPLHLSHNPNDPDNCGIQGCTNLTGQINANELINFYNQHWRRVKEMLANEREHPEQRSELERRYGIEIVTYSLAETDFTPETQAAQEEKLQAGYRKEAGLQTLELAVQIKKLLPNLPDQQALNVADSTLNPSGPRQVISVEGDAGVLGALAALTTQKGGKQ